MTEIMRPQAPYSHEAIRNLIEDVTQSSAMRLDTKSMGKLWDLITMIFKWQLTLGQDAMKVTARHLYEIENYVTTEKTQLQLHKVQNLFDNFNKVLNPREKNEIKDYMLGWLRDFNVRVSLLLRLGLQESDGNFVVDGLSPFTEVMLKNLGENIYSVTQNAKFIKDTEKNEEINTDQDGMELQMMVDQIMGQKSKPLIPQGDRKMLRLTINKKENAQIEHYFDSINIIKNEEDDVGAIFEDLSLKDESDDNNLNDDLLDMIAGEFESDKK